MGYCCKYKKPLQVFVKYFFFTHHILQSLLDMETLLCDFSASHIERTIRLLDGHIKTEELIPTMRGLLTRYPLERQKRYV